MNYIDNVFGPSGCLSRAIPDYEVREGQIALARAIDGAIEDGADILAEGPTGVGKSFAYCVPAVYQAVEKKVGKAVIATANIALQEQLVKKDLPFLQKVLPWEFRFALMKGRNNYLCLVKKDDLHRKLNKDPDGTFSSKQSNINEDEAEQLRSIQSWMDNTETGDKSDLVHSVSDIWWRVSSTQDDCLGGDCPFKDSCWGNRARKRALGAHVVVMNYHLRFVGEGAMTPDHAVMICDEAHEAANIARDFLGWSLTVNQINRLASWVKKNAYKDKLAMQLRDYGARFFEDAAAKVDKRDILRLYEPDWSDIGDLLDALKTAREEATSTAAALQSGSALLVEGLSEEQVKVRIARANRASESAAALQARVAQSVALDQGDNWVHWIARDSRKARYSIEGRPVEVSDIISDIVFGAATHSVAMVSATMTTNGSFDYVAREVGAPADYLDIIADSPFDLKKQGLLFIPEEMSPPPKYKDRSGELAFQNDVCFYSEELIKMCGGRTLLLFTSWVSLNVVHAHLSKSEVCQNLTLLKQGDMPRMRILRAFKENETSVLLGVASFWTGVDVPGRSLTGLLVDKIPFSSPSDPVNKAACDLIRRRGGSPFTARSIPEAAIKLRQGTGRLIRTVDDVGIVCITDTRLLHGYGKMITKSLPDFRRTTSLDEAIEHAKELLG